MKLRTLPLTLLAVCAAALLSLPFFLRPLLPWPDQGLVLHAAVRDAQGLGLTTPVPDRRDLTLTRAEPLTYFPPLLARGVSLVLRLAGHTAAREDGPDLARARVLERSVKLVNAAALVIGAFGWCLLASRVLASRSLGTLFAGLLPVAGGATVPIGGTADYVMWAAMPWWLLAWLAADAAFDPGRWRRAGGFALGAGALGALSLGVRWAALFLVPAAVLFALVRAWRAAGGVDGAPTSTRGAWSAAGRRVALAALGGAPIAATYLVLTAWNRRVAGSASVLSYIEPGWDWSRWATLYPFEAVVTLPLALEPLLTRVWRALDPARASVAYAALFRVALPLLGLLGLWGSLRRARRQGREQAPSPDARRAFDLAFATLAALLLFLAFLSLRYTWSFADWSYLDEPRYFRPVWPLAALLWLLLVDRLPTAARLRTATAALLLVGVLYVLQGHGRTALGKLSVPEERHELVAQVRALERRPGLHVVLDNDVSEYVLAAGRRLLARGYPDPADAPSLSASRPAELWCVRRLREPTPYVKDRDWDRKRFEALRARFPLVRAWTSSGGAYEIWHVSVGPPPP